jgi:hypothetical protein
VKAVPTGIYDDADGGDYVKPSQVWKGLDQGVTRQARNGKSHREATRERGRDLHDWLAIVVVV